MKWNRNVYALILLISLVVPCCAVFMWYQAQLYFAAENAQIIIKNDEKIDERITLKFSLEVAMLVLDWEHAHEFEFEGEMYDVVSSELMGDSVTYHCYHDTRETKIKKKLLAFMADFINQGQPSKKQQQHAKDFFKSICFDGESILATFDVVSSIQDKRWSYLSMHSTFVKCPAVPPPRILCLC